METDTDTAGDLSDFGAPEIDLAYLLFWSLKNTKSFKIVLVRILVSISSLQNSQTLQTKRWSLHCRKPDLWPWVSSEGIWTLGLQISKHRLYPHTGPGEITKGVLWATGFDRTTCFLSPRQNPIPNFKEAMSVRSQLPEPKPQSWTKTEATFSAQSASKKNDLLSPVEDKFF